MTKYILLYNYFGDEEEYNNLKVLEWLIPDLKVRPFQIIRREKESGKSIWIPEEKYLMAWTIWNYEDLMGYVETGDDCYYETIERGLEWYKIHAEDDIYVWFDDGQPQKEVDIERLYQQYIDAMKLLEEMQDKMSFDEFGKYIDILENNGIKI